MTPAHRVELTLTEDGKLTVDQLPFRAGQAVEVIVLPAPQAVPPASQFRGKVLRFDCPFEPVADADWDALK